MVVQSDLKDFITKVLPISITVILLTFPEYDCVFETGIDGPLPWVFNMLFSSGSSAGQHIIFPHGPLAFLMYPLHENLWLTIGLNSLLRLFIAYGCWNLIAEVPIVFRTLITLCATIIICLYSGINHLILASCILAYCNFFNSKKVFFKLTVLILSALAIFVKSYVGIISAILFMSFLFYQTLISKKLKKSFIDILTYGVLVLLVWLLLYNSKEGVYTFLKGVFYLALDNSSAAAYYPLNNWKALIPFLILLPLSLIFGNSKRTIFLIFILFPSLFAAWKHGMAREDVYHMKGLLNYLLIALTISLLFRQKNRLINLIFSMACIICFSFNLPQAYNYTPKKFKLSGPENFIEFITNYNVWKEKAELKIADNVGGNKLSKAILNKIGTDTVDIYPWDYSIVAANNLSWIPRPVIHSYAAYRPELDELNKKHFQSKKSPKFIVWHFNGLTKNLSSIDDRYLLNNEPLTLIQLLKSYKISYEEEKILLLEKRKSPLEILRKKEVLQNATLNSWIPIKNTTGSILKTNIHLQSTFIQKIKSFIYKDEQFWIYLRFTDSTMTKHRFVPKNAKNGLWINPYYHTLNSSKEVSSIYVTGSNQGILNNTFSLQWENVDFKKKDSRIPFFEKKKTPSKVIFRSENDFENPAIKYWSETTKLSKTAFSGKNSSLILKDEYSSCFSFPLDSLSSGEYTVMLSSWIKATKLNYESKISAVISIEEASGTSLLWKANSITSQIIEENNWNLILSEWVINKTHNNTTLKIYIKNSSSPILIDELKINISQKR